MKLKRILKCHLFVKKHSGVISKELNTSYPQQNTISSPTHRMANIPTFHSHSAVY